MTEQVGRLRASFRKDIVVLGAVAAPRSGGCREASCSGRSLTGTFAPRVV